MVLTIPLAVTDAWKDIGVPLIIAFFGAGIAAFWPWIQALQRCRRFERIICRELEEIGPHPDSPKPDKPWWNTHSGGSSMRSSSSGTRSHRTATSY
jgi:hypothetical protein